MASLICLLVAGCRCGMKATAITVEISPSIPIDTKTVWNACKEAAKRASKQAGKWITWKHVKMLQAIARCRTAALGGHLDECARCGHRAISYNSCRNRHCPKCQASARERWLEQRRRELLPTPYVHQLFFSLGWVLCFSASPRDAAKPARRWLKGPQERICLAARQRSS
jgi:hypothetical protein